MNKKILEQAKIIAREDTSEKLEEAQQLLLRYLTDNPKDTEAWLLLIRIECNPPLYYPDLIIQYSNKILEYEPNNALAVLFIAYAEYYLLGGISADTYSKLNHAKSDDVELMAMIEIAKSRYFEQIKDIDNFEKALKKSIEYSDKQTLNFYSLGILYLNKGRIEEGRKLIEKGLKNVKRIFPVASNDFSDNEIYDPTNFDALFNEFYARTTISRDQYTHLQNIVHKYS